MAITVPTGCERQPRESVGVAADGSKTFAYVLKGPYNALETLLDSLKKGDEIVAGWNMSAATLTKCPGTRGELRIDCTANDTTTSGEGQEQVTVQKALDETWTLRSVRNDVSILAYCGPSASNPSREQIEAWMKEPDGTLAAANKYRKADGTVEEITDTENLALIAKIRKGIDSVMRFYPMLTKTTTFTSPPLTIYENLARVDTPAVGTTATTERLQKPGNLATIIAGCEWLKCQDDCALTGDGKFQRIESWLGIPITSETPHPWDADLYGENAWDMPLHTGGSGGVST